MKRVFSAIALSISARPGGAGIFRRANDEYPEEIYKSLEALEVMPHISMVYGENVEKAAKGIYEKTVALDMSVSTFWDNDYPELLREIAQPPLVLFYKGVIPVHDTVAIVGTRRMTQSAAIATEHFSKELVNNNYAVVSGLAAGVDAVAHRSALGENGPTIAVMASGLDKVYPFKNRSLFDTIILRNNSCALTELPPGVEGGQWAFARRNRIISGLSRATLVVQAPVKSGALITAQYALDQNRDVMACPGSALDKEYEGCNSLIRNGATPVWNFHDLLSVLEPDRLFDIDSEEINSDNSQKESTILSIELSKLERVVVESIPKGTDSIDALAQATGESVSQLQETIICLELKGLIVRQGSSLHLLQD